MKLTTQQIERVAEDLTLYMVAFQGYEKLVGFSPELDTFKLQMDHFDSIYQTCRPISKCF